MPKKTDLARLPAEVDKAAWAVDASCPGNPGPMEYRAVDLASGRQLFHFGPLPGTNNIAEFLAIVHALALQDRLGIRKTIYTDSANAILWIRKKQCKTQLPECGRTEETYDLIERAHTWLRTHAFDTPILKWQTRQWGEIPADFGRKR